MTRKLTALTMLVAVGCTPLCVPNNSYCPNECIEEPSPDGCTTDSDCEGLAIPTEWEPTNVGMWV